MLKMTEKVEKIMKLINEAHELQKTLNDDENKELDKEMEKLEE
jgi:flagellin-specific chaperone FliS